MKGGLTFWHTTQRGRPRGSSHSPGPSGNDTSPSLAAVAVVPSRFREPPRPLSFHRLIPSSMAILLSSGSASRTVRRSSIHSLSCRTQDHGSDQSRRTTSSVFGIDCGVRSGLMSEAKEGEGLVRRYVEIRASMSVLCQRLARSVEPEGRAAYLRGLRRGGHSMYSRAQTDWPREGFCSGGRSFAAARCWRGTL